MARAWRGIAFELITTPKKSPDERQKSKSKSEVGTNRMPIMERWVTPPVVEVGLRIGY